MNDWVELTEYAVAFQQPTHTLCTKKEEGKRVITLLVLVVLLLVCSSILVGLALALAFVLSALLPSVAFGMCIIAGSVLAVGVLDLLIRFLVSCNRYEPVSGDDVELEDPVIVVPSSFLPRSIRRGAKRKK